VERFDKAPEILLVNRKGTKSVVAIDFFGSAALDPRNSLVERRQYILTESLRLCLKDGLDRVKDKNTTIVKIFAVSVPDRNEYALGKFNKYRELAIMSSDPQGLRDDRKSMEERLGEISWKGDFKIQD